LNFGLNECSRFAIARGVTNSETRSKSVASGIHEAFNYLAIVKKVIERTERAVARRNSSSDNATLPTGETLT